jgi:hypothetical protein
MKSENEIRKRLDQLMQQRIHGRPFSKIKDIAWHGTKQALEWVLEEVESPITYK